MNLYRNERNNPKDNAQANLCGRTHYVDSDTLRFHKSRILVAKALSGGLLFGLVESYAVTPNNATYTIARAFRPVIFNLFGSVIHRPPLLDGYRT